jgi:hypothetical protein
VHPLREGPLRGASTILIESRAIRKLPNYFLFADESTPRRNLDGDHSEIGLSQLRISESIAATDMIYKGRTGGDQFETSAATDQQMNWWVNCKDWT